MVAQLDACVAALEEIDGTGHGGEADALLGRAALHVVDVAVEGLQEEMPRLFPVATGMDPRVDDAV